MQQKYMKISQIKNFLPKAKILNLNDKDFEIKNFITDSRVVKEGDCFIALKGEKFDAHDFLYQVKEKKASICLVSDINKIPKDMPAILVENTLEAIQLLAKSWRIFCSQHNLKYLALVTGSNGKTTVKGMISEIFNSEVGEDFYLATNGNLNNEIGLPLTLLRLNLNHKLAVIELGMNHPGETKLLTEIANPEVVLINNAQREHQEFMHSVDEVSKEHGLAIVNANKLQTVVIPFESEYFEYWKNLSKSKNVISFGWNHKANIWGDYVNQEDNLSNVSINNKLLNIKLNILGKHNTLNAFAASAVAYSCGISEDSIRKGLENFQPVEGRMQTYKLSKNIYIINDAYNANPDSVMAAIDVLSSISKDKKSIMILGDMGEVGENGADFHKEIGDYARQKEIKELMTIGNLSKYSTISYLKNNNNNPNGFHFDNIEKLSLVLSKKINDNDNLNILIKGSRFMRLERLLTAIIKNA